MQFAARLNAKLDGMGWPKRGRPNRIRDLLRDKVSDTAIRKWLEGDTLPELKRIYELSKICGTSAEFLLTGVEADQAMSPTYSTREIPLIEWSALKELPKQTPPPANLTQEWIPCPVEVSDSAFALVVQDESMISDSLSRRSYPPGTMLFVDQKVEASSDKKVIAIVEGNPTFRVFVQNAGVPFLKSVDGQYPFLDLTNREYHIIGVVVGSFFIEANR